MNTKNVEQTIHQLLLALNIPAEEEVLRHTPARVANFFAEALAGYKEEAWLHEKTFKNDGARGLILVQNIEFHSLCQHHLLPFFGTVSIGYIPDKKLLGLSKFSRIVQIFARRLQLQENLTVQILQALTHILLPKGLAVVVHAKHMCMCARGAKEASATCTTREFSGIFTLDTELRQEFLSSLQGGRM